MRSGCRGPAATTAAEMIGNYRAWAAPATRLGLGRDNKVWLEKTNQPCSRPNAKPATLAVMDTAPLVELAEAHLKAGRLKQAAQFYGEALRGEPDHVDALYGLGRIARAMGQ